MKLFQLYLLGNHEPLRVEFDCSGIDELAELASRSRFVIGNLADADERSCNPKLMIAASRISCAIEG